MLWLCSSCSENSDATWVREAGGRTGQELYLLNYLDESDKQSLLNLGKDSITRKYGELAVLTPAELDMML